MFQVLNRPPVKGDVIRWTDLHTSNTTRSRNKLYYVYDVANDGHDIKIMKDDGRLWWYGCQQYGFEVLQTIPITPGTAYTDALVVSMTDLPPSRSIGTIHQVQSTSPIDFTYVDQHGQLSTSCKFHEFRMLVHITNQSELPVVPITAYIIDFSKATNEELHQVRDRLIMYKQKVDWIPTAIGWDMSTSQMYYGPNGWQFANCDTTQQNCVSCTEFLYLFPPLTNPCADIAPIPPIPTLPQPQPTKETRMTIQQLLFQIFGNEKPTTAYDNRPAFIVVAYNRDGSEMGTATASSIDAVKAKVAATPELWGCKVLTYKLDKEVSVAVPVQVAKAAVAEDTEPVAEAN